ncbi:MAG: tetratricopeptide (TPR) repeat protein [Planctomycetota bacterium]|jgi:tetratricopeptide (TPR) repeat protein
MRHSLLLIALAFSAGNASATPLTTAPLTQPFASSTVVANDLIKQGRALLKAGKTDAALALFEQADKASGQSSETHIWVLRAWMDQDRINDAFNEADKLRDAGHKSAGLDYLYGYGSFAKAKKLMREGAGASIGFAFGDAVSYLQAALDQDEATFADAWVTLAHASWYAPELDRAERAILKAVEHDPKSALVHSVQGEIYFSLYKDLVGRTPQGEAADRTFAKTALASFSRAADLTPDKKESAPQQFAIWRQMGNVHAWLTDLSKAGECFAEALSWDPQMMDYNMMWQTMAPKSDLTAFNASLATGLTGYKKRFGEHGAGAGMLLWWLGYGQLTAKDFEAAEVSFLESVERNKDYANSWFYVGMARYYQAQYQEACEGWLAYWDIDPTSLVTTIRGNVGANVPILVFATGKVSDAGYQRQDSLANWKLAERMNVVLSATEPGNGLYWNNLGLLRRDIGELTMRSVEGVKDEDVIKLYEDSYVAYAKAVSFAPNDPGYLNDAAVLLQYYLGRDLDTAREYYDKAQVEAQKLIEAESWASLPADKRADEEERIRTALRDGADNLRKMDAGQVGTRNPIIRKQRAEQRGE